MVLTGVCSVTMVHPRFGRHGSLTVHRLESEPLRVVKGSSPGDATVMDVNNSTLIYVGGLGERIMVGN